MQRFEDRNGFNEELFSEDGTLVLRIRIDDKTNEFYIEAASTAIGRRMEIINQGGADRYVYVQGKIVFKNAGDN